MSVCPDIRLFVRFIKGRIYVWERDFVYSKTFSCDEKIGKLQSRE